jgi:hypothetical protein
LHHTPIAFHAANKDFFSDARTMNFMR